MNQESGESITLNLKKGELVFATDEEDCSLFFIHAGKVLTFVNEGTKITPLSYIDSGEYLGELSFFDRRPRSASVICLEDTSLVRIPVDELSKQFPPWLITVAQNITQKLRTAGDLIRKKGIRRKNVKAIKPLTIEEQRYYFQALQDYRDKFPSGRH